MTDYPEGARLRVAFDVTVIGGGGWQTDRGHYIGGNMQRDAVSVERLPDPEPDWQPGDVIATTPVLSGRAHTLLRTADGQWRCTCATGDEPAGWVTARWNAGGVTPLVRGGKPWGEA